MSTLFAPLPLHHSWPLFEQAEQFRLGALHDLDPAAGQALDDETLATHGIGRWHFDLLAETLTWSTGVFDIFGLPRAPLPCRADTVALYSDESRAAMERLRAHAIRHRRGFTLDARIRPARGKARLMRLIAVPVCEGTRVIALHGLKRLIRNDA